MTIKDDQVRIQGSGGGGSKAKSHTPVESPNTLQANVRGRVLDLIAYGPIYGLVDGLKSVYLDNTPVMNTDGTLNFSGIELVTREGYPDQEIIPGFRDIENAIEVGAEVLYASPPIRAIQNNDADAAIITVQLSSLVKQEENGDSVGAEVQVLIDVRNAGGAWVLAASNTISGKTTSAYPRSFRVPLSGSGPFDIRVRRGNPESTTAKLVDKLSWTYITEVIDERLNYPNMALVGIAIDAKLFGNDLPPRSYDMKLSIVKVPSNYDPVTRVYTGLWDGTFKMAWTDNPAWCYYDLATHPVIGADIENTDKWVMYRIGQYCDELVPDGYGGMEPRFTCNTIFAEQEDAVTALNTFASGFRGMAYWGTDAMVAVADMPTAPIKIATPSNVIDGDFDYVGTSLRERHSVCVVMWNDPKDSDKAVPEIYEDPDSIAEFGWVETRVTAVACNSRGQAHRLAKWILYSERMETQMLTYRAVTDQSDLRPGDVVEVADPFYQGARMGGRVLVPGQTSLQLDKVPDAVILASTGDWWISVALPSGQIARSQISSFVGNTVHLLTPLPGLPLPAAVFGLSCTELELPQYRVVSNVESDGIWTITATEYDPTKYSRVEFDLNLPERPTSMLPSGPVATPMELSFQSYTYIAGGTQHQAVIISWTPPADVRVQNYVLDVQGPGDTAFRTIYNGPGVSFDMLDILGGEWMIRVRSVSTSGVPSAWYSRTVQIAGLLTPVKPDDVEVTVTSFTVTLRPKSIYPGTLFEFWRSFSALPTELIESNAVRQTVGTEHTDHGLSPATLYFYYVRGTNAYGLSDWFPVQATTANDASEIMKVLTGKLTEEQLYKDLTDRIDLIDAAAGTAGSVNTRLEDAAKLAADATKVVSDHLSEEADRLDGALSSVNTKVTSLEGETNQLKSDLNQIGQAVDGIQESAQGETARLDGLVDGLTTELEMVNQELDSEVGRLDGRVSTLNTNLSEVQVRLGFVADKLDDQVEAITDAAATTRNELRAADIALTTRLNATDSAIVNEATARSSADSAMTETVNGVKASVASNAAGLASNTATIGEMRRVIAEGEALEAIQFEAINASNANSNASIRTEESARVDGDTALAIRASAIEASVGGAMAAITTEAQARADKDSALASQIGELSAKVEALPQFGSGFELGADYDQWTLGSQDSITAVTANPYAGSQCVRLSSTAVAPGPATPTRVTMPAGVTQAFDGFEIVVRIAAMKPATTPSTEFAIRYSAGTANSGWRKFTPTANWAEYEFSFTVPEGSKLQANQLQIWADTSGTGKGILLDSVRVSRAFGEIAAITAAITAEQTARANADGALATEITGLKASVGTTNAAITAEQTARASADTAFAGQMTALTGRVGTAEAGITSEQSARVAADSALASRASSLEARTGEAEAAITAEQSARSTADTAMAGQISGLTTTVGQNTAAITAEQQARSTADAAMAGNITAITARVSTSEAAIISEAEARVTADSSMANDLQILSTRTGAAEALIATEQQARTDADSSLAARTSKMEAVQEGVLAQITESSKVLAEQDFLQAIEISGLQVVGEGTKSSVLIERDTRVTADEAIATQMSALSVTMGQNTAAITAEQTARVNKDSALANDITVVNARVTASNAAITSEQTARANADGALASDILAIRVVTDGNTAAITAEQQARTSGDSALTSNIDALRATVTSNKGTTDAAITAEQTARANADSAMASDITGLKATTATTNAAIANEASVRASADSAQAASLSMMQAGQDGNTAAINNLVRVQAEADALQAIEISSIEAKRQGNSAGIYVERDARVTDNEAFASELNVVKASVDTTNAIVAENKQTAADATTALASKMGELSAKVDARPQFASGFEEGADYSQWVVPGTDTLTVATEAPYVGLQCARLTSTAKTPTVIATSRAPLPAGVTSSFDGYEVVVRVAARKPVTNPAAEFAIAYSSGSAGNSGWKKFALTTEWTEYEFTYVVPEGVQVNDYLAIWADTSGTGKGVVIDAVQVMRSSGEIAEITAAITAEQTARVTKDNALTLDITGLKTRMGSAEAGLVTETSARVAADSAQAGQITALTGRVGTTEAGITTEQQARVAADNALASRASSLETKTAANDAAITAEQSARTTADNAMASDIGSLRTTVGEAAAAIINEAQVRSSADSSLASLLSSLTAANEDGAAKIAALSRVQAEASGIQAIEIYSIEAKRQGNSAQIYIERDTRVSADEASATEISGLTVKLNEATANILEEKTARITADSAMAQKIETLQVSLGPDGLASIEEKASVGGTNGNRFPTSWWKHLQPAPGYSFQVGSVSFTLNGLMESQWGQDLIGPNGVSQTCWSTVSDGGVPGPDGGWLAEFKDVDPSKTLILSVWVKATNPTNGDYYLGCGFGETENLDGTPNTNPYFVYGDVPSVGDWYLAIGILHAAGYAGGQTGLSGLYDPRSGARRVAGTDLRMKAGITTQAHRCYHYYSPNYGANLVFAGPRFERMTADTTPQTLMTGAVLKQLSAQKTLSLDVNGYISGYGSYNDGRTSTFAVLADQFYIASPSSKTLAFITINGVNYLNSAVIQEASITTAHIATAAITSAKIAYSSITWAHIGVGQIGTAHIGDAHITTLKIAGNAVTVPSFAQRWDAVKSTVYVTVLDLWIYMDSPGWLYASSSGYIGYGYGWGLTMTRLLINGQVVAEGGGESAWVSAAHSGAIYVGAGSIRVELQFISQSNMATMFGRSLFATAVKR